MKKEAIILCTVATALTLATFATGALAEQSAIVGRWDLTVGNPAEYPSWLGVKMEDGKYVTSFIWRGGGAIEAENFKFAESAVSFKCRDLNWAGILKGDTVEGICADKDGNEKPWVAKRFVPVIDVIGNWSLKMSDSERIAMVIDFNDDRGPLAGSFKQPRTDSRDLSGVKLDAKAATVTFTAGDRTFTAKIKGDVLEGTATNPDSKFTAERRRMWNKPIQLFNGKDLAGWKPLRGDKPFNWKVVDGIMSNTGHGGDNIVTENAFKNFKMHVEFKVPEGGNSGVYLRGRHEIQVSDSFGKEVSTGECGAIYSRIAPAVNASKKVGEWQEFDITLVGHYVTVVHNGKTIIDNQEIEGITGGALDSNENGPGPIYLQGDHTEIFYRKITLIPTR